MSFAQLQPMRKRRAQLTITIPTPLVRHVEELAGEYGLSKSAVIASILEYDMEVRHEALMRQGYEEMARAARRSQREERDG